MIGGQSHDGVGRQHRLEVAHHRVHSLDHPNLLRRIAVVAAEVRGFDVEHDEIVTPQCLKGRVRLRDHVRVQTASRPGHVDHVHADCPEHPADQRDTRDPGGGQVEPLGDRHDLWKHAGTAQHDGVRWRLAFRDAGAVDRMGLEDLVRLFREGVDGLGGHLRRGLERFRFLDRLADLMGIGVGDPRREATAPQDDRDAVFGSRSDRRFDPTEFESVKCLRQFVGPLADPTGAAVDEFHLVVDRGEVPAERDVSGFQVDAHARGLERTATSVDLVRIVSEER